MLAILGYNLESESFRETPRRFAKFMQDFAPGKEEPEFTVFPTNSRDLVIVRDLEVRSMCAHHLAPFFGKCTIAYYPKSLLAGLSKFQRTLDYICMEPTEQETLTYNVSKYLRDKLQTQDLVVIMDAQHTCYSEDTEVLTELGFVNIGEMHLNLKKWDSKTVATYNLETNKIEYQKPTMYHQRYYKGKMIEFFRSNQLVTPNHRVVYRTDWDNRVEVNNPYKIGIADNLQDTDCIIPIAGKCDLTGFIPVLKRDWDEILFAELLGLYIAEGSYSIPKYGSTYCRISQNKTNLAYSRIEYLLTRLGIEFTIERNRGDNYNFKFYKDKELVEFLVTLGRSADKFIPDNYKYCDPDISLALLRGFYLGDGSLVKNNKNYTTMSYRLASDIQEILTLNGVGCKLYKRPNANCYDVIEYVRKDGAVKPYIREYAKDINEIDYDGNVYCLSVPNTTLVMRRRGKVFISGNCMIVRGVQVSGSTTRTITAQGKFKDNPQLINLILNK